MKNCDASALTAGPPPAPSIAAGIGHLAGLLAGTVTAARCVVEQWLYRRRYRYELYALSDRQLADMGIDRDALEHEVKKPFWIE